MTLLDWSGRRASPTPWTASWAVANVTPARWCARWLVVAGQGGPSRMGSQNPALLIAMTGFCIGRRCGPRAVVRATEECGGTWCNRCARLAARPCSGERLVACWPTRQYPVRGQDGLATSIGPDGDWGEPGRSRRRDERRKGRMGRHGGGCRYREERTFGINFPLGPIYIELWARKGT